MPDSSKKSTPRVVLNSQKVSDSIRRSGPCQMGDIWFMLQFDRRTLSDFVGDFPLFSACLEGGKFSWQINYWREFARSRNLSLKENPRDIIIFIPVIVSGRYMQNKYL